MVEVDFDKEIKEKLEERAEEANLSLQGLIEVVMGRWVSGTGGRVYTGRWSSGEVDGVKGMRYVVQWPFMPGFIEAEGDLVKKWRLS